MKNIKSFTVGLLISAGLLTSQAQTNVVSIDTNAPSVIGGANQIVQAFENGMTNWYFEVHGLYAPSLEKKYGGGAGAFYQVSDLIVAGVRLDYVDGDFWMPSGNIGIQLPIKPTSWLTIVPLVYSGIGIPVSGAKIGDFTIPGHVKDNSGNATAILGYGAAVHVLSFDQTVKHWWKPNSIDLVGDRENWSGFPGNQWRGGIVINKKTK